MTKIVYNRCFGGFSVSRKAIERYAERKGLTLYWETSKYGLETAWTIPPEARPTELEGDAWHKATQEERISYNQFLADHRLSPYTGFSRTDPDLVAVVEELGKEASGFCADLAIAEIPEGARYRIDENDGNELVMTPDDYEWSIA